jgi:hypothetical protein
MIGPLNLTLRGRSSFHSGERRRGPILGSQDPVSTTYTAVCRLITTRSDSIFSLFYLYLSEWTHLVECDTYHIYSYVLH